MSLVFPPPCGIINSTALSPSGPPAETVWPVDKRMTFSWWLYTYSSCLSGLCYVTTASRVWLIHLVSHDGYARYSVIVRERGPWWMPVVKRDRLEFGHDCIRALWLCLDTMFTLEWVRGGGEGEGGGGKRKKETLGTGQGKTERERERER